MNEKIGIYTEDEILEHLTEGEGRSFLGRSMYDAIFDKIHALKTEKEQLKQENKRLEMIIKEYERLNKVNGRDFKITNVKEYNIDELLSYKKYKDNWNKLKEFIVNEYYMYLPLEANTRSITILIDKMQKLEQGSDSNE